MKYRLALPVVLVFGLLVFGSAQPVEGAAFLSIKTGASVTTCDTTSAGTIAATCALDAGFTTALSDEIVWLGVFGGYSSPQVSLQATWDLTSGSFLTLSTDKVRHLVAGDDLTIDFAATFDEGGLRLNAAQTGNYNTAVAGLFSSLTAFAHAGPVFAVGGGDATAAVPDCVPAVGNNMSCSENAADITFAEYGVITLLGRQVIHQDVSLLATKTVAYTSSVSTGPIPEPTTILLFGSGLLGIAALARFRRKQG